MIGNHSHKYNGFNIFILSFNSDSKYKIQQINKVYFLFGFLQSIKMNQNIVYLNQYNLWWVKDIKITDNND
jgi:hypothetical protein